jgi:hypothetical protein
VRQRPRPRFVVGLLVLALTGAIHVPATAADGPPAVTARVSARDAARTLVVGDDADLARLRRHPHVEGVEHDPALGRYLVRTSGPAALARELAAAGVHAEPVALVHADADVLAPPPATPSDPFYRHHWGAHVSALPYGLAATRWSGPGPIVAVLDTGVAPHPELGDRLLPGADLVSPGGDGRTDPHGHGTNTALTVAAAADDGRGSTGSCPRCRILPIRVLDAQGVGTSTAVAQGIRLAVEMGAHVINVSAGGTRSGGSFAYEDAVVAEAAAARVPILASAGNEGTSVPQYPAAMDGVIAVAGVTETGARAPYSNHGSWVDVAAPWCSIVGTPSGASSYCGTSASAPFASGLVALRRATVGAEPVAAVRAALLAGGHQVSWVAGGWLDACAVVRGEPVVGEPTTTGWASGAAPADLPIEVASPCGATRVTVSVDGRSVTRHVDRASGRLSFRSDAGLDLGSLPDGEHRVTVATTDALGRTTTVARTLVVAEAAPATTTAPVRRFTDVQPGSTHDAAIHWLAEQQITGGCNPDGDRYCPSASVTRAQMASFLRTALALPPGPTSVFTDVAPSSVHASAIGAMREEGITRGCEPTGARYCPGGEVTRAQMASFLTRALDLPVPSSPHGFADVPADAQHADAVAALHAAGITGGCDASGTRFCPEAPVTRAQMATFLRNALQR